MKKALNLLLLFGPAFALGFAVVFEAQRVQTWREQWQQEQREERLAQAWGSMTQAERDRAEAQHNRLLNRCETKCGRLPQVDSDLGNLLDEIVPATQQNGANLPSTTDSNLRKSAQTSPQLEACWAHCEEEVGRVAPVWMPRCGSCEGDPLERAEFAPWRDQFEISIAKNGIINGGIHTSKSLWRWYVVMTSAERHDALCMGGWLSPECADGPQSPENRH